MTIERSLSDRTISMLLDAAPDAMLCVAADGRIVRSSAARDESYEQLRQAERLENLGELAGGRPPG